MCEVDSSLFYNHCGRNTEETRTIAQDKAQERFILFKISTYGVCCLYEPSVASHVFFLFVFCMSSFVSGVLLRSSVTADELRSVQGAIVHPYRCQDEVPRRSRVCFQHRVLERRRQRGHHRGERPGNNNVVPNILGDYFTSPLSRYRVKHDALITNTHQS